MKVLVLGAGGAASNGFARALRLAGGYELVGANCSPADLVLSECDTNHLIPAASDFDAWREAVDQVIRAERPAFVHAQSDVEVEALARARTMVHMLGCKTWLPSVATVELCRDKWASYEVWRDAGVPVPETSLAGRPAAIARLLDGGDVWLRPRVGAGGQRSLRTGSWDLAQAWLRHHGGDFTVARALGEATVTVQQLYWQGALVCSQQRTRESWANAGSSATGVSGSTGVGVTSSDAEADRVADAAVEAVDDQPHGLYGVDMCRGWDGDPCVTEINIGRFFTTAPEFFASAGFNMADVYVREGENAYYMNDQGFELRAPRPVERNPLPDGLRWVRSMDRAPLLDVSMVRERVAA